MGFGEAIGLFFKNYTNFQGRSRRAEFWWPLLVVYGLAFLIGIILGITGDIDNIGTGTISPVGLAIMIGGGIAFLAIILPIISLTVRRLHDLNQTGWLYLALIAVAFIPIAGDALQMIATIVIGVIPGTKGPNKYGQDPLGGMDVDAFD